MALMPMAPAPMATPRTDALRQQLMAQLLSQGGRQPSTMGEGVGQAAQSLANAFLARQLIGQSAEQEQAGNSAAMDFLAGAPGEVQFGPALPGGDLQGLERGPGTPGMLPGMSREQIQQMMLMPGGREALMQAAMQHALPEPMTAYQKASLGVQEKGLGLEQARIGQDQSQFEAQQVLAREKMEQDAAISAADRQARLDAAGLKNPLDVAKFKQDLRNEVGKRPEVAGYQQVAPAVSAANAAAKNDTKAADLNIVYAFATSMDPGSVVREGEQLMVRDAGSLSEQALGYINALNGGGRLTPQQRAELLVELNSRADIWHQNAVAAVQDVNAFGVEAGVMAADEQLIDLPELGERFAGPGVEGTQASFSDRAAEGLTKLRDTAVGMLPEAAREAVGMGAAQNAPQPPAEAPAAGLALVQDQVAYDALPPGAKYHVGDGVPRTKR